jgi:PIN domain nuclease of toxin-antitoxin system
VRLLLDTHALLWWLADDERLGSQAREVIADPSTDILVSVVSLWEIVVKVRVQKLEANIDEILQAVAREGFGLLEISPAHLRALAGLPRHHRDPFDHLLIAQAITEGATFISEDANAPKYPVQTIACSNAVPGVSAR